MKKYITSFLVVLLLIVALPTSAATTTQINAGAKAALIKELTIKLNELIKELNVLIEKQDSVIRTEASTSLVSAEIFYTSNMNTGYVGACKDAIGRIMSSIAVKNAGITFKPNQIQCFDSKNGYALSIKNSKGYSCADSTGTMKSTLSPVVGVTCPVN
jgi:hypothetical protein